MASRQAAQRATARAHAKGQRRLPPSTTRKAREYAKYIEPIPEEEREFAVVIRDAHPDDREWIIKMSLAEIWDTDYPGEVRKWQADAESAYNYAQDVIRNGADNYMINIVSYRNIKSRHFTITVGNS